MNKININTIDLNGGSQGSEALEGAIRYDIVQDLTPEQQMQARKNQGLYYSQGTEEVITISWDGSTSGKTKVTSSSGKDYYKIEEITDDITVANIRTLLVNDLPINDGDIYDYNAQGSVISTSNAVGVCLDDNTMNYIFMNDDSATINAKISGDSITLTKGVWVEYGPVELKYIDFNITDYTQIEPEFITDKKVNVAILSGGIDTLTIFPNIRYVIIGDPHFSGLTLTINKGGNTSNNISYEYTVVINMSNNSNPITVTWPTGVVFKGNAPTITANKVTEVSIVDNLGVWTQYD